MLHAQINAVFGECWSIPPLFYRNEFALRFELATGRHPIDRFLAAHARSLTILSHQFAASKRLIIVAQLVSESHLPGAIDLLPLRRSLDDCGLPWPKRENILVSPSPIGDVTWNVMMAAEFKREWLPRFLWAAVSCDMGVMPACRQCRLYVLDLDNGCLAHPYDDRGMDVVGTRLGVLRSLYETH